MRPQSLHTMRGFSCVCIKTQITVHTHLLNRAYFDHGKIPIPRLKLHAGMKMAQVWDLKSK